MALEAMFLLLEGSQLSWEMIVKKMSNDQFITRVINIDLAKIKTSVLTKFKKDYVNTKEWDLDKLKKASKAMGPIGAWLESLTKFVNQQEANELLQKSKEMVRYKKVLEDLQKKQNDIDGKVLKEKTIENDIKENEQEL